MAEMVMKELLLRSGRSDIEVESAALHTDELGNDIHYGTRTILRRNAIPFTSRRAWLLTAGKAKEYDMLIGMDSYNRRDLKRLLPDSDHHKIYTLLEFAGSDRDIADPWYTGDFEPTYRDVMEGCTALLKYLSQNS